MSQSPLFHPQRSKKLDILGTLVAIMVGQDQKREGQLILPSPPGTAPGRELCPIRGSLSQTGRTSCGARNKGKNVPVESAQLESEVNGCRYHVGGQLY